MDFKSVLKTLQEAHASREQDLKDELDNIQSKLKGMKGEWKPELHSGTRSEFIAKRQKLIDRKNEIIKAFKNESICEGFSKRSIEDKLEKICTCDGETTIDSSEHKKSCPAYKYLKDLGF